MTRVANTRSLGALSVVFLLIVGLISSFEGSSSAQSASSGGTFTDDDGSIHEENIEAIAAAGITAGCDATGTLFCPSSLVTRGQMATFLARALDLPASTTDWFPDDDGSTHEANINAIADAGITLGLADGTYNPAGVVRRDQMASFLARGIDGLADATTDYFTDDDGNVHEMAINQMAENAISLGCNAAGTEYCPSDDVRRGQMASFLARGLGLDPIPTTTSGATTSSSGATTSSSGATTSMTMAPMTVTVEVLDNSYDPMDLTINLGDSADFSKMTAGNHNINFDDASIDDSGLPSTGQFSYLVTFDAVGTFTYRCDVHGGVGMTGTITVNG